MNELTAVPTTSLYFESHVTIEPVFDEQLDRFKVLAKAHRFYVADLLMKKRAKDTLERSRFDTFATSRGQDFMELRRQTLSLVENAKRAGFIVWRYKIENTLEDVRLVETQK